MTSKHKFLLYSLSFILSVFLIGCSSSKVTVSYDDIEKLFVASYPSMDQKIEFSLDTDGDRKTIEKNGKEYRPP